ncbi:pseudouridine synthase [Mucilaginibacter arboris]|uniref:Pseudouridine synthase n=1 Tax=Mucilaginibacter arboris TaxID=2682090 RepID=A0A7K1SW12_9SPHI|nr:pseudouridine synthase [Mucilaginibacter arboris]MVN21512.1 pseudouridine synthase [Mucilaginibacter arboris]
MAYKKQGNSRDDKSAGPTRRTGKPSTGRSFSSSSKNENIGGEGSFKRKPSAFGAPKKSFGGAKEASVEKRFGKPSAENNRFKSRNNSNASFTGKKLADDTKPFRKSSTEGKPFKERSFSVKPASGSGSERPFRKRNSEGFQEGRSREKSYKSSNSEGRPYQKDFSGSDKRYVKNGEEAGADKKPVMRSRNKTAESGSSSSKDKGLIRLNRYIANAGICSRRKADELIEAGVVSVNGEVVSELGAKIDPIKDVIRYNGETLKREKMVYVLLNKPKDYITTTDDPQERRTVMQLVEKASRERIYPVGRLDRNTTGLLLMTNDGELAEKLSHPRSNITKIYNVELDKSLTQGDLNKITYGLELEDGLIKPDAVSYVTGGSKREVGIQIHSGKNRIVRRIFEHLGYEVVKLDRVIYANLTKKDLTRGRWRYLDEKEVIQLKHLMK